MNSALKRVQKSIVLCLLGIVLLTACRPIPLYVPPITLVPNDWKEGPEMPLKTEVNGENWWLIFNDSVLNDLEKLALANSPTLEAAAWNAEQAWSVARASISPLIPNIGFAPSAYNQVQQQQIQLPGATTKLALDIPNSIRFKNAQYTLPIVTSYEFDLWSKFRYGMEAAFANSEAQQEAWKGARLSLTAAVANAYFTIRGYDAEEKVLKDTINVRQAAFEVNSARFKAGIVNYADVSRAETEVWLAKADLAETYRLRALQEHLLAVLIGEFPLCYTQDKNPLSDHPPYAAAVLPSEVLLRRPDIAEAERNMASLYAIEGQTYSRLFPSLALSLQLGLSSPFLSELLDWRSRLYSLAWESFQTIFDAGKKENDIAAATADFNASFCQYTNTVLTAFEEVEDALSSLKWQKETLDALDKAVETATISTLIASERYTRGLVTYLEVVDAERTLLETELNAVRVLRNRFISTVNLIKAIGGSWENPSYE